MKTGMEKLRDKHPNFFAQDVLKRGVACSDKLSVFLSDYDPKKHSTFQLCNSIFFNQEPDKKEKIIKAVEKRYMDLVMTHVPSYFGEDAIGYVHDTYKIFITDEGDFSYEACLDEFDIQDKESLDEMLGILLETAFAIEMIEI